MKDFTIGADPEFMALKSNNKPYNADKIGGEFTPVGADGCGTLFEIRPDPSYNPLEVVINIRQCLLNKVFDFPSLLNYTWKTDSCMRVLVEDGCPKAEYQLGGHIHFGIGNTFNPDGSRTINADAFWKFLWPYLGAITILMEKPAQARNRRKHYGSASNCRYPKFGIEYRAPSSWVGSPHVAAGVLCLAKVVAHEHLSNPTERFPKLSHEVNQTNQEIMRRKFPTIWKSIQKMKLYPEYAEHLEIIPFIIRNKLTWHPKVPMQEAWGLQGVKSQPVVKKSFKEIWE